MNANVEKLMAASATETEANAALGDEPFMSIGLMAEKIRQARARLRIDELTAKIPTGTMCDESNNCGGYLTADECDELEELFKIVGGK